MTARCCTYKIRLRVRQPVANNEGRNDGLNRLFVAAEPVINRSTNSVCIGHWMVLHNTSLYLSLRFRQPIQPAIS